MGYLKKQRGIVLGGDGRGEEGFQANPRRGLSEPEEGVKRTPWTPSGPSTAGRGAHEIIILYPYFCLLMHFPSGPAVVKIMLNTTKYDYFNCM